MKNLFVVVMMMLLAWTIALVGQQDKGKLRATATPHSVILKWTNSVTACVQNTNLHRVLVPGTAVIGQNYAVIPVASSTYTDTQVTQGTTYYYTVSAWGSTCGGTGNESLLSPEVSVLIPVDCLPPNTIVNGVCTAPPQPPTNFTGVPQ